ncbi:nuclear transport factor 2 family protein [Blastomonas sp.]|uniref:nuclear transport factor 2 family protein n=1 Tax=Blastomonas sp. TaxID=1909299 RepID=UPI00406A1072
MDVDLAALQTLLDKEAIREVALRYARGIDRHDDELLLSAYHPDASDDHGSFIGSSAAFVEYANRVHARNWVCHQHYITNQVIDLHGDTAHCESYFLAVLKRPDGVCDMVGGRYVDRIDRRDGQWAVAERICMVEWNAEAAPGAVAFDASIFIAGTWDRSDPSYTRPLCVERPPRDLSLAP